MVRKRCAVMAITFILMLIFTVSASAAEGETEEKISREYRDLIESVPQDIAEYLPTEIFSDDVSDIYGAAVEMSSFSYIFKTLFSLLGSELGSVSHIFAGLLGLVVLSAVLKAVGEAVCSAALRRALSFCSAAATASAVMALSYGRLYAVSLFLDRLNLLTNSLLPIMGTLYAMGGNVAAAAVNNSTLMLFLTVCENLFNRTLMPVSALCLAFSLVGTLSDILDLRGVAAFVKKAYTFFIGFVMMSMMFVLSVQSTLASAGDSMGARTAKYMAGQFIPVVGGAVGDSLRTVAASVKYIRSSVGAVGIVIIVLMLAPTLLSVASTRLCFMTASGAARLLGCSDTSGLLGDMTNIYGYMLAVISACSVLLIFALTLLAHTSAAFA